MEPGRFLVLVYEYVDDIAERRGPHRPAHLELLQELKGAGTLVAAGATGDPPTGALIVFAGESEDAATAFVASDPYVAAGLVTSWRIVPWTVAV